MNDPRKTDLVSRLRDRETLSASPGTTLHRVREFYQNITPNRFIGTLEAPMSTSIQRFTPCGKYLLAFHLLSPELVIFRYTGLPPTCSSNSREEPLSFDDFFGIHCRCRPTVGEEDVMYEFTAVMHGLYVLVASSIPDARYIEPEGHWLGVEEVVTFHCIELSTGEVIDTCTISAEGLEMGVHNSVSIYENTVAVLSPRTIIVFEIAKDGKMTKPNFIGKYCTSDDEEIVTLHDNRVAAESDDSSRVVSTDLVHDARPTLDGLKQRLLAHMYMQAIENEHALRRHATDNDQDSKEEGRGRHSLGNTRSLGAFYYYFEILERLDINHIQLLDDSRILICWGKHVSLYHAPKTFPRGLRTVYNMKSTKFEKVFDGDTREFEEWCILNPEISSMSAPSCPWENFASGGSRAITAWQQQSEIMRDIPPVRGCQKLQLSPYLDRELFHFDEKTVSRDVRSRAAGRLRSAKFIAHSWPEKIKFSLNAEHMLSLSYYSNIGDNENDDEQERLRSSLQVVNLFHPVEPTVFSIVESNDDQGVAEIINIFSHIS